MKKIFDSVMSLFGYVSNLKNSDLRKISYVLRYVAAFITVVNIFVNAVALEPDIAVLADNATLFEPFIKNLAENPYL